MQKSRAYDVNNYVETKSKCDIVVEKILEQIIHKKYKAGDKLPNENMLCEEFGVSRITVREAVKRLSMLGLVSTQQGRGTFITKEDLGTVVFPMIAPIFLDGLTVKQVYEARVYIESGNARLAAQNRTQEDVDKLWEMCTQMDQIVESCDPEKFGAIDEAFHMTIAQASQNAVLLGIYGAFERILKFYIWRVTKENMEESTRMHKEIVRYIEDKDEEGAGLAMEKHCENAQRVVLKVQADMEQAGK